MRRRFRRDIRKTLAQEVPPILQEAHFTFDKGEYGRAAELFERIARGADERGGPRAPMFHLQAGRARVLAGQVALGMPSIKRGLELFAQRKQYPRLNEAGNRVVRELNEKGLKKEADEIDGWLRSALPSGFVAFDQPVKRPTLPTHCPSCGAPLKTGEVEWLDDMTAECLYCGSPVRE